MSWLYDSSSWHNNMNDETQNHLWRDSRKYTSSVSRLVFDLFPISLHARCALKATNVPRLLSHPYTLASQQQFGCNKTACLKAH